MTELRVEDLAMGFSAENQEWKKRSANKGGRPTREEARKKKALEEAKNRQIKKWAKAKADWSFATMLGMRNKRCPFREKIS